MGAEGVKDNRAVDTQIQYVRSGGVAIAYQVVGGGDVDLVYVPDYFSNLVYDWEYPRRRTFFERFWSKRDANLVTTGNERIAEPTRFPS